MQRFDAQEKQIIVSAIQAAGGPAKVIQRKLARELAQRMPGRQFAAIYRQVREMTSPGGWFDGPVGHKPI
jgi:hypothetical protein